MKHSNQTEKTKVSGYLTISTYSQGELVRFLGPLPNKVVSSDGYGRNIIARQLAGDNTYTLEIDSASLGDDNTAATDGDTDLGNVIETDIPISNIVVTDNEVQVDVFVADGNLTDDIYEEFGLYCNGRLFARIIISPAYTKASGEDTLFTYTLTLTG